MLPLILFCLIGTSVGLQGAPMDQPSGAYHYLYATSGETCNYCQHKNNHLESTWSINAPLGEPYCHQHFRGNLTVFTVNKTWANITFSSNRLVIYDFGGCVEYFSDSNCSSEFLIANECLDNSTKGTANVTLFVLSPDSSQYHYDLRCYCFEYRYGPCYCNS